MGGGDGIWAVVLCLFVWGAVVRVFDLWIFWQKMLSVTLKHVLKLTWLHSIMYSEKLENSEYLLVTLFIEIFCFLDFKNNKLKKNTYSSTL